MALQESGLFTIRAERHEATRQDRHSEFRYGSLSRRVALPEGANADKITARYDMGILEVTVPVPERAKAGPATRGGRAGAMAGAFPIYS